MFRKSWIRFTTVLLAFGLVAAACGGGDDDSQSATETPEEAAEASGTDGEADASETDDERETAEDIFGDSGSGDDAAKDETEPSAGPEEPDDSMTGQEVPEGQEETETRESEEEAEVDICETAVTEDVEIGVSADEITVLVSADVNTPLAPGLFQGAFDGAAAWAGHVNANGGLACRQINLVQFDTLLNPSESVNAQISACENALAMVGTTALFVFDVEPLNTCPDTEGNPIGLPDIAALTTEVAHQCSLNTFAVVPPQGACPYEGTGERLYGERVGHLRWIQENIEPDLVGVFLVPGDLPSTRQTGVTTVRAMVDELGVIDAGTFGVSGSDLQAVYGEWVQAIADNGANYARTGSDLQTLIKLRSEAEAQGVDVAIWECTIACYDTAIFEEGGGVEDGTYMTIFAVPFEEADTNAELQDFVDNVDEPSAFALNAWVSGVLFEQAVNQLIESTDDVNAITRANLIEALKSITTFDANGALGTVDPVDGYSSECYVLLQIQGQEFVRIHPEERGTFDCDPSNKVDLVLDAAAEANEIS